MWIIYINYYTTFENNHILNEDGTLMVDNLVMSEYFFACEIVN